MFKLFAFTVLTAATAALPIAGLAAAELDKKCLEREVSEAEDFTTVADLRKRCTFAEEEGFLYRAEPVYLPDLDEEQAEQPKPVRRLILAHRPNYFVMSYYDNPNNEPFNLMDDELQRFEAKFQLSFKLPVWKFNDSAKLFLAYTGRSWWQVGDKQRSRPFRETNHHPEAFVEFTLNPQYYRLLDDLDSFRIRTGVSHESNGQVTDLSRSWNRVYFEFQLKDHAVFTKTDQLFVSFQPWLRIQEDMKEVQDDGELDPTGDDNPNIERFAGQAELVVAWRPADDSRDSFSLRMRNNLRADNRGLLELGWGRRISKYMELYGQFTTGYAESLLDYRDHSNRIAIGARLTDFF